MAEEVHRAAERLVEVVVHTAEVVVVRTAGGAVARIVEVVGDTPVVAGNLVGVAGHIAAVAVVEDTPEVALKETKNNIETYYKLF